jgi:hypothetical protein
MGRRRWLVTLLSAAAAAAAVTQHGHGAAMGRRVPGGILIRGALVYHTLSRLLLGPFLGRVAADVAAARWERRDDGDRWRAWMDMTFTACPDPGAAAQCWAAPLPDASSTASTHHVWGGGATSRWCRSPTWCWPASGGRSGTGTSRGGAATWPGGWTSRSAVENDDGRRRRWTTR